jgi:hypothetical protein
MGNLVSHESLQAEREPEQMKDLFFWRREAAPGFQELHESLLSRESAHSQISYFFSTGYLASDHSLQPPLRAFALKPFAISFSATRALVPSFGQAQ